VLRRWAYLLSAGGVQWRSAGVAGEVVGSGKSSDVAGVGSINGDLTVALSRLPLDEWIGVQADSHTVTDGVAVGAATLFDHADAFGSGLVTAVSQSRGPDRLHQ